MKELAKTYDQKGIEDRLYQKWEDNKYIYCLPISGKDGLQSLFDHRSLLILSFYLLSSALFYKDFNRISCKTKNPSHT